MTVAGDGVVPTGTVIIIQGDKQLGTGHPRADGKVTIKITKSMAKTSRVGKVTLKAKYQGSANV